MVLLQGYQVCLRYPEIPTQNLPEAFKGIQGTDDRAAPTPLGMDFPYEPGDKVHFLGPKGHGRILTKSGENYRIAHSGTRITSSIKKCMAPTVSPGFCKPLKIPLEKLSIYFQPFLYIKLFEDMLRAL
jgi:hypothetical protein